MVWESLVYLHRLLLYVERLFDLVKIYLTGRLVMKSHT